MRTERRSHRPTRLATALLGAMIGASPGWALDVTWITTGAGNWSDAVNWSPGVPAAGDDVFITQEAAGVSFDSAAGLGYCSMRIDAPGVGALLDQSANTLSVFGLTVEASSGGSGTVNLSGGTHAISTDLVLGSDAGAEGYYKLSGTGSLTVSGNEMIGQAGNGTFDQSSGSHAVGGDLFVDAFAASKGTFNLSGGSLAVTGTTYVGNNAGASGTFEQSGGTHAANDLVLGIPEGATGYYKLHDGTLTVQGSTVIGSGGNGSFTQEGGTFAQHGGYGALVLGSQSTASGSYTLVSGVLDMQGDEEYIGSGGSGTFTQIGGEHGYSGAMYIGTWAGGYGEYYLYGGAIRNAKVDGDGNPLYGGIVLGEWSATGHFFHSGGTVTVDSVALARQVGSTGRYQIDGDTASLQANWIDVGKQGDGAFVHSAGSVAVANDLNLAGAAGVSGTYQLSGGTLSAQKLRVGQAGNGTFTQTGGTLTSGDVIVGVNSGSLGTYSLQGGTLNAPQITVYGGGAGGNGQFLHSGGELNAGLHNYGLTEFSGSGVRVVNGDVTNEAGATMIANATEVQINGTLWNNGAYISDPSINTFADLIVAGTGYLAGGPGDQFRIGGMFESHSTQNALWDSQNAQLVFIGDTSHAFWITGADLGPTTAGYDHNFGWGDLQIEGEMISLADGNATPGGALYVGTISGPDILYGAFVQNIQGNGLNIYYEPLANPGLAGLTYGLADGGSLAPVPEPGTWAMFLSGLGIIGFVAIRRMSLA